MIGSTEEGAIMLRLVLLIAAPAAFLLTALNSWADGKRGVAEWTKDLDSESSLIREEALELLARAGPQAVGAAPKIKKLLDDGRPVVRLRAAMALLRIEGKSDAALGTLVEAARKGGSFERLLALETALDVAGSDHHETVALLASGLTDPDVQGRVRIEMLLARLGSTAVPALLKMAGSKEDEVVHKALWHLERRGIDAATLEPIVKPLLKDKPPAMRALALSCLLRGRADPEPLLPTIKELLKEREAARTVYTAIFESPARAKCLVPILEEAMAGADVSLKVRAAGVLWEIDGRTKETLPILVGALKTGGDPLGRSYALQALAMMGQSAEEIVPALMEVLRGEPMYVSPVNYAQLFNRWGDAAIEPTAKFLNDKDARVRSLAMQGLGLLGEKAVPHLVKALDKADGPDRVKIIQAFGMLRSRGDAAVPVLVEVLKKGVTVEMVPALTALANMGPSASPAVPRAVELLKEANPPVVPRAQLCALIGNTGPWGAKGAPSLLGIAKDSMVPVGERHLALRALGQIGEPAANLVDDVIELADKEPNPTRPIAYAAALRLEPGSKKVATAIAGWFKGPPAQVRPLVNYIFEGLPANMKDAEPTVAVLIEHFKKNSADALLFVTRLEQAGELDLANTEYLKELLRSDNGSLALHSAIALANAGELDDPRLPSVLDGLGDLARRTLVRSLARHGPKARPLAEFLRRSWEREEIVLSKLGAAEALANLGKETPQPVVEWLKTQSQSFDPFIAAPALAALARIDPTNDPIPKLRKLLGVSHAGRYAAAEALGNLGTAARPAVPDLETACKSPDYLVRLHAAAALWKIDSSVAKSRAALVEVLRDRQPNFAVARSSVLTAVGSRPKEAAALVPDLLAAARRAETFEMTAYLQAVRRIDPAALKSIKAD
jgi:HEAT repeat protein